jgi:nucleoside-diphosphate-sugar epimerase
LGEGHVRLPLVYIADVVDSILLAAESDLRDGEIIQVVDPEALTQNEVLQLSVGHRARVIRVPRALVFTAGKLSELLLGPLGRKSPLSVYRLRSALACRSFASERCREWLAWQPRVGVREGIRRTLQLPQSVEPIYSPDRPILRTPEMAAQSD